MVIGISLISDATPSNHIFASLALLLSATFSTSNNSSGGLDPTVVAALIGLAGLIVGASITFLFARYQMRRNAQLERERLRSQQEILRLQSELDEQILVKER